MMPAWDAASAASIDAGIAPAHDGLQAGACDVM
jgi:hypothetical protein